MKLLVSLLFLVDEVSTRKHAGCTVIDDRIYVAGGDGPGMNQTEVEVYDPVTNTWADLARMNVPRNHTAGAAINGKFYVAGGRPGDTAASALEVYDPKLNSTPVARPDSQD